MHGMNGVKVIVYKRQSAVLSKCNIFQFSISYILINDAFYILSFT